MPDDAPQPLALTEALESPANALPAGSEVDLGKLKSLQDRVFRNRTRLLDRFNQLPLYGKPRKDAKEMNRCQWKLVGTGGDHPLVQMILSLRMDEEELESLKPDMEAKDYLRAKLSIKSKVADLLLALQKENDQVYSEMQDVINLDQRKKEHADKMAVARDLREDELSDAQLIARAKEAGIPLLGEDDK